MPSYKNFLFSDFSGLLPSVSSLAVIDNSMVKAIHEQHRQVSQIAKLVDSSLLEQHRQINDSVKAIDSMLSVGEQVNQVTQFANYVTSGVTREVNTASKTINLLSSFLEKDMQRIMQPSFLMVQTALQSSFLPAITDLMLPAQNSLLATFSDFLSTEFSGINSTLSSVAVPSLYRLGYPLKDIGQNIQSLVPSLAMPNMDIADIMSSYNSVFSNFISSIQKIQESLEFNLRHFKEATKRRLLNAFKRAMLWPVPSMTSEFLADIDDRLRLNALQTPEQLVDLVLNFYSHTNCHQLEKAISEWWSDSEYELRRTEIEEAFAAHKAGKYRSSIKILLDLVEGIARAFFRSGGYTLTTADGKAIKQGNSHNIVTRTFEVMGGIEIPSASDLRIIHDVMVKSATHYIHDVYKTWNFETQYDELRNYPGLSRHGLSHGIQIAYASCINSLRCFLLLDALFEVRKHYNTGSGFGFF